MPIEISKLKKLPKSLCKRENMRQKVESFLLLNPQAFTVIELREILEDQTSPKRIWRSSIYLALDYLRSTGKIKKKGSYFWYEG